MFYIILKNVLIIEKVLRGPKKKLFVDDESFVMKRTIPPLDKVSSTYLHINIICKYIVY